MVIVWLLEWASHGFKIPSIVDPKHVLSLGSINLAGSLRNWLSVNPSRWITLGVWFFLFSTMVSTIFSGTIEVSIWGEVPGQDGYAAYTWLSYLILFSVVSTHLKYESQRYRLLGAIVGGGVIV